MQDLLEERSGYTGIKGPRPVLMQAFQDGYLTDGEIWMEMLKDRNRSVHTYDADIAKEVVSAIRTQYYPLLEMLFKLLQQLAEES